MIISPLGKRITLGIVALLALVAAFGWSPLNTLLAAGTGIVAKTVCSGIYLAGRNQAEVITLDTAQYPNIFNININNLEETVNVTVRHHEASAKHYPGVGCLRKTGVNQATSEDPTSWVTNPTRVDQKPQSEAAWPQGGVPDPQITNTINRLALQRVIATAFDDPEGVAAVQTRAVAIVWRGQLIAERYAEGFNKHTPLMGWSMSKSITNALIGLRIGDGVLALDDSALLPQWRATDDARRDITLDALLRMSSGLEFNENYFDTGSDAINMLFGAASGDMAGFAASKPLAYPVNSHWSYSSGTTNILQRILRNTFSSTANYLAYVQSRLLQPLGMAHTQLEVDATGTLVGSSFGYASARDWARFGQLFLQDGTFQDGAGQQQRLLPEGWVAYSTTPTPTAPDGKFGAHWWLNHGPTDKPTERPWPKLPQSVYRASGFEGQMVMIVPTQDLVVVRLGLTVYPASFDFETFTADVIQVLLESSTPLRS